MAGGAELPARSTGYFPRILDLAASSPRLPLPVKGSLFADVQGLNYIGLQIIVNLRTNRSQLLRTFPDAIGAPDGYGLRPLRAELPTAQAEAQESGKEETAEQGSHCRSPLS